MNRSLTLPKNLVTVGIPLFMVGMLVVLVKSPLFASNPTNLEIGITVDLLVSIPFIYFLLIRKTKISKTTLLPFLIGGMVIASLILPPQNQYYLGLFKTWVFPLMELGILSLVIYKVTKAVRYFRLHRGTSVDFYSALKETCETNLPRIAVYPAVTEIAVFYYGFVDWKKRKLKSNEFSYHKESGTIGLFAAILFLVIIETFVFHLVLVRWSELAAWILTFLSVYSGFQLFGFLKSMYKRPISIENGQLHLRYGMMSETTIDLSKIESVEVSSKDIDFNSETRKLSILGDLENHNLIIRLKEKHTIVGLYGITRKFRNLALHVDEKLRFAQDINQAIQNTRRD